MQIHSNHFFFAAPSSIDIAAILPKWEEKKQVFFEALVKTYAQHIADGVKTIPAATLEANFKELATAHEIKPGDLLLPLRIMLVGGKFGPGVFEIIESIELSDTNARIEHSLRLISEK